MKRGKIVILASIFAAILLAVQIVIIRNAVNYQPEVTVLFAKSKIPAKTEISDDMIVEKKVGINFANKLAIKNKADVIGKSAAVDIEDGEMLLTSRMVNKDELEASPIKDKNNRLFTIEFKPDQANGWWLQVDQFVDIYFVPNEKVVLKPSQMSKNPPNNEARSDLDIDVDRVLTYEKVRVAGIIDEKGKHVKASDKSTLPKYISFEVTPEQAKMLAFAKSNGRIEISLVP